MQPIFIIIAISLPVAGIVFLIYRAKLAKMHQSRLQQGNPNNQQKRGLEKYRFVYGMIILLLVIVFGTVWQFCINKIDIAPQSKWHSILVGKWSYSGVQTDHDCKYIEKGNITFSADESFIFYLKIEAYPKVNSSDYADVVVQNVGGSIEGKWSTDADSSVNLVTSKCKLENGYGRHLIDSAKCYGFYMLRLVFHKEGPIESKFLEFSKDKIVYTETNIATESKLTKTFQRDNTKQ